MRDRIRARLGVVHATLAAVSASVVKLHVLELGEAALPQHPEAIGELTDELDAVASTLEDGLAVLVDDADVRA
jgi:hypothetical protein